MTVALGGIGNSLGSGQPIKKVDRFLFLFLAQMRISERHGHGLVAQDLLYHLEACPAHNHVACKCVAQVMESEILNTSTPA